MQRSLLCRRLVALHAWQSRDRLRKPKAVAQANVDDVLPRSTIAKSAPSFEKKRFPKARLGAPRHAGGYGHLTKAAVAFHDAFPARSDFGIFHQPNNGPRLLHAALSTPQAPPGGHCSHVYCWKSALVSFRYCSLLGQLGITRQTATYLFFPILLSAWRYVPASQLHAEKLVEFCGDVERDGHLVHDITPSFTSLK